jgi:ABC-type transport system involved in multi-copper enzyme maturation permease subunit
MMVRSLKRIAAVGTLTSTEGLRQPAFFVLLVCATALTALAPQFAVFHLGEDAKMVTDLGLSTVLTFSTLLALLTASTTISSEIEGRTALTMLAKPLRREEFLVGKFLGIATTAGAFILLMSIVLLATLRTQQFPERQDLDQFAYALNVALLVGVALFGGCLVSRLLFGRGPTTVSAFWLASAVATVLLLVLLPAGKWEWRILVGMFFIVLHACVISAFAVALATRLTLVQAAIGTAAFFVIGHASGVIVAPFQDQGRLTAFGSVVRCILPDLDQFNLTDALARSYQDKPVPIPWELVAGSSLYAVLYGVALLAVAVALFQRRELA